MPSLPRNPIKITGYEKAWGGATPTFATALALLVWWPIAHYAGWTPPTEVEVRAAVVLLVVGVFNWLGAYIPKNTGSYSFEEAEILARGILAEEMRALAAQQAAQAPQAAEGPRPMPRPTGGAS